MTLANLGYPCAGLLVNCSQKLIYLAYQSFNFERASLRLSLRTDIFFLCHCTIYPSPNNSFSPPPLLSFSFALHYLPFPEKLFLTTPLLSFAFAIALLTLPRTTGFHYPLCYLFLLPLHYLSFPEQRFFTTPFVIFFLCHCITYPSPNNGFSLPPFLSFS